MNRNRPLSVFFNVLTIVVCSLSYSTAQAQTNKVAAAIWYKKLPACPCKNPDYTKVVLNDGWAKDKGDLAKYHKGAVASYRSYPPVKTPEGLSCQQCCYDGNGNLITGGRAAGTPDKKSTCKGEDSRGVMKLRLGGLLAHYRKDVLPWSRYMKHDSAGWIKYNQQWKPDNGNNCMDNPL